MTRTLQIFAMGQDPRNPADLALAASHTPTLEVLIYEAIGPDGTEYEDIRPKDLAAFIANVPHDQIEHN